MPFVPGSASTPAEARETLLGLVWDSLNDPIANAPSAPLIGPPANPPSPMVAALTAAVSGNNHAAYCASCDLFALVSRQSDLVCSRCKQVGHLEDQCRFSASRAVDLSDDGDDVDPPDDDGTCANQTKNPTSVLISRSDHVLVCRYCKQVGHAPNRCPHRRL